MSAEHWAELKAKADRWACGEGDVSEAGRAVQECLMEIQEQRRSLTEQAIARIRGIENE